MRTIILSKTRHEYVSENTIYMCYGNENMLIDFLKTALRMMPDKVVIEL